MAISSAASATTNVITASVIEVRNVNMCSAPAAIRKPTQFIRYGGQRAHSSPWVVWRAIPALDRDVSSGVLQRIALRRGTFASLVRVSEKGPGKPGPFLKRGTSAPFTRLAPFLRAG